MTSRATELPHGYTLRDLDAMARAACAADRPLDSAMATRYQVVWFSHRPGPGRGPHWPCRRPLVDLLAQSHGRYRFNKE